MATIYSAEQIRIPPELPEILKNYAKFIIKQQPSNIMQASATYFSKLSTQTRQTQDGKLTDEQLQIFLRKFSVSNPIVTRKEIQEACEWADITAIQINDTFA